MKWFLILFVLLSGCINSGPVRVKAVKVWKEPETPVKLRSVEWWVTLDIKLEKDPVKLPPEPNPQDVDSFYRGYDDAMRIADQMRKDVSWPAP